jgi:hypothetical protein
MKYTGLSSFFRLHMTITLALLSFLKPSFGQSEYVVTSLADLQAKLLLNNCTIIPEGIFVINTVLALDSKSNVTIKGRGAVWKVNSNFRFRILESSNIRIEDINIVDEMGNMTPNEDVYFDFVSSKNSGLENITSTAAFPKKGFARIRSHSDHCYVRNCTISTLRWGIKLGDAYLENNGNPTVDCQIEHNTISNFDSTGISAATYNGLFDLSTPDSKTRHTIKSNILKVPNFSNGSFHVGAIEITGGEALIEENVIFGNSTYCSFAGIDLYYSYRPICRNNRVTGPYTEAAIRLANVKNGLVTGNVIEGVGGTENGSGISVCNPQSGPMYTTGNIISQNQIENWNAGINLVGEQSDNTLILENQICKNTGYGLKSGGSAFQLKSNGFSENSRAIYCTGGANNSMPNHIVGNSFSKTTGMVMFNENSTGFGRPFIFENNQVTDWGNANETEAIQIRCGSSVIANNDFLHSSVTGYPAGSPLPVMAVKYYGYGVTANTIKDNRLIGANMQLTTGLGAKVGLTAAVNANCCGTDFISDK